MDILDTILTIIIVEGLAIVQVLVVMAGWLIWKAWKDDIFG